MVARVEVTFFALLNIQSYFLLEYYTKLFLLLSLPLFNLYFINLLLLLGRLAYDDSIPEPTPSTMTALHQFGAEMLKLSRGLESFTPINEPKDVNTTDADAVEPTSKRKDGINNFQPSSSTMDFHINNNDNNIHRHKATDADVVK